MRSMGLRTPSPPLFSTCVYNMVVETSRWPPGKRTGPESSVHAPSVDIDLQLDTTNPASNQIVYHGAHEREECSQGGVDQRSS
jgi:hypothetical protein